MDVVGVQSERELSKWLGYGRTTITSKRQRGSVPYEDAAQVALDKGVSLDWLILGRGEAPAGAGKGSAHGPAAAEAGADAFVSVPLYDLQASAGDGRFFDEERVRCRLMWRRDWLAREGLHVKDLVALEVTGDSMNGTIQDRDTVLINRAHTQPDGVFLVRAGEALRIKRVQQLADGSIRLSSDNDHYAPEVLPPEQLSGNTFFEILGHCHWRGGRVY